MTSTTTVDIDEALSAAFCGGQGLDSKAGTFEPATFRDRYEEALLAHLLKAKQAGAGQGSKPTFAVPRRANGEFVNPRIKASARAVL